MKSCTGAGKSAELAWIGWWRLSCFGGVGEHPKGAAISGEGRENLRDNLWSELKTWQLRSPFLTQAFTWNHDRIYANDHSETWFLSARGYPKDADADAIGRSLSGLHSKYPFLLLDEVGDMPVEVGQKAEQIFTGGPEDALIAAAGNPTSTSGLLYHIAITARHLWVVITITADPDDPRRTPRVPIEHAQEQIAMFGRENPWIKATILGEFPEQGFNTLLGVEQVEKAMSLHYKEDVYGFAQKRLGVDVAFQGDDRTVLFPRQGLVAFQPVVMRTREPAEIAARVMAAKEKWGSENEFVDGTGGYGSGVLSHLRMAGYGPIDVQFAGKAISPRHANKRAEMWWNMADWVKGGGALPPVKELIAELTVPTYTMKNGKFLIEPKELIKKRLKRSPDCFVAGTMVRTRVGPMPIETLRVGDYVNTPMGSRRILKVWQTETEQLTTVRFSNGTSLCGKGKHEIFTWDKGWVRLDALSLVNHIESDSLARRLKWLMLRKLFTAAEPTEFKRAVDTISRGTKLTRSAFFTVGFGSKITAQFQRAITSIIKTVIGETIASKTWSWFPASATVPIICASECRTPNSVSGLWPDSTKHRLQPPPGMPVKKGWPGTLSTEKIHGRVERLRWPDAQFAIKRLKRTLSPDPDFVPGHASRERGTRGLRHRLASALCAVKNLLSTSIAPKPVVPVSVETVTEQSPTRVYNLTLDADNVYYANGVLVANCADALALTFALPEALSQVQSEIHQPTKLLADYDPFDDKRL
jgi:hypothetical protein